MIGFENIEQASLTDVGVRRSHNQDSHTVLLAGDPEKWRQHGHVFVVADGMGAHAVGELASALAVGIIPHTYHKHAQQQGAATSLRKAFIEANASIHARGQQNREFEGMGTTSTALLLRSEGAWVGHVGDSRAYRIRDGHVEQLSFDHSLVWEYARRQRINPENVQGIPSNVIVRSLGPEPLVQVDVEGPHPVQKGDIYVLCSDGLSGQVSDHEIGAVASVLPPEEACRFLVDLANLRGGPDNITVVVVRIGLAPVGKLAPLVDPRPWYQRVPWPLGALLLGTLGAGGGAALAAVGHREPAYLAFLIGAAAILAGLVGLLAHHNREKQKAAEEEELPPPRVYSRTPCQIERSLLERLAKANEALKQRIREQNWEADWRSFDLHSQLAAELVQHNDLPGAFREFCRAMRPLTETVQRYRNKEEMFQPVWDRSENGDKVVLEPQGNEPAVFRCENCGKTSNTFNGAMPTCCDKPMPKQA